MQMLRIAWLVLLVATFFSQLNAQSVFIPDVNLRAWFDSWVDVPVDANGYLDTTNSNLHGTFVDLNVDWSPSDLTGIQYVLAEEFTISYSAPGPTLITGYPNCYGALSIRNFPDAQLPAIQQPSTNVILWGSDALLDVPELPIGCQGAYFYSLELVQQLPALPPGLTDLTVDNLPSLTSLPLLPQSLKRLEMNACPSLAQPSIPDSLESLLMLGQPWLQLNPLPTRLKQLSVENTALSSLPAQWPDSLEKLTLRTIPVNALPPLQHAMRLVELVGLNIDSVPAITMDQGELVKISDCPALTYIPPIIFDQVRQIWLEELPLLPTIPALNGEVFGMRLIGLPLIQTLEVDFVYGYDNSGLICTNMPLLSTVSALPEGDEEWGASASFIGCPLLFCLPELPWGLTSLQLVNTGITCVPNHPGLMAELGLTASFPPICNVAISSCPQLQPVVVGQVFEDIDQNGALNAEPAWANAVIECSPGGFIGTSGADGSFSIGIDTVALQMQAIPALYEVVTTPPTSIEPAAMNSVDTVAPIGLSLIPGVYDMRMAIITTLPPVPGLFRTYSLIVQNLGGEQSGELVFNYPVDVLWQSSSTAPATNGTGTATWSLPLLPHGSTWAVQVVLTVPVATPLGTVLTFSAQANAANTDNTIADNSFVIDDTVVGSYDPNDKTVSPTEVTSIEAADGVELTYTIRFQNTGTWPASRVVITDTLSSALRWNTISGVSTSHPANWFIQHGVLHFVFDPISLFDSISDEPGSHGYVQFRMRTVGGLSNGATVANTANIYFDFNEPVITAPAVFSVNDPTAIHEVRTADALLYPNPAGDQLYIQRAGSTPYTVRIVDGTGRELYRGQKAGRLSELDVRELASGSYVIKIVDRLTTQTMQFIKR